MQAPALFDAGGKVPLPKGLNSTHIKKAVDYIEKGTADLIDIYLEQANVFSGIVGIYGVKALHHVSPYKKHKHPDVAQQRFPDLSLGGKLNPPPSEALESKGSTRAWAIQSHYNHPGWYVVWRYLVDPTESVKPGRPVVIWRVDVVFLNETDWKYETSKAGAGQGGRTIPSASRRRLKSLETQPHTSLRALSSREGGQF